MTWRVIWVVIPVQEGPGPDPKLKTGSITE